MARKRKHRLLRVLDSIRVSHIVGAFFVLIACFFYMRLYDLQVVQGAALRERIDNQYSRIIENKSINRGDILFTTKNGDSVLAATMRPLFTVAIDVRKVDNAKTLFEQINSIMPVDEKDFFSKASKTGDPYEEIALKVERSVVDQLKEIKEPGLVFVLKKERFYPGGDLGSPVVGFMSFNGDKFGGSYGLEKYYNEILNRDSTQKPQGIFSSLFSAQTDLKETTDIKKNIQKEGSLHTTIEPTVQRYLEKELDMIIKRFNSKYSAGIIMDSDTGAIVAMSASDNFDLNKETKHYTNYLVEDRYELGSILKPLTVAIGLETGAINKDFSYNDTGRMVIDRYPITNFDKRGRGPYTDLQKILTNSLNTGVATIALSVGNKTFKEKLFDLGLNTESGIDLPGEVFGLTSNLESGRDVEVATASFGQGIAITPIEATRALASLHNGGSLVTPHIVSSIEYGDLIPTRSFTPSKREGVFSKDTTDTVLELMTNTVDDSATFSTYSDDNFSVAVKTGTAQIAKSTGGYYSDKFLHSIIGFVPADAGPDEKKFTILLFNVEPKGARYSSTTLKDALFSTTGFLTNYYELSPDRLQLVRQ